MPPRIAPIDWRSLRDVFLRDGFREVRTRGDHLMLTKDGVSRPVVIPMYDEVSVDIIMSNLRTAGIDRERYFLLLKKS